MPSERIRSEQRARMDRLLVEIQREEPQVALSMLAVAMSELQGQVHALERAASAPTPEQVVERHETQRLVQGWEKWRSLIATAIVTGLLSAALAWTLGQRSCNLGHDQTSHRQEAP